MATEGTDMMKYRKKPVVIEAIQWTGNNTQQIMVWAGGSIVVIRQPYPENLTVQTLEGEHRASVGDYIIKGVKGEFYPCKPDIFEMTYEAAP